MALRPRTKATDDDSRLNQILYIHARFRIKFSDSKLPPSYKTDIKLKCKDRDP